MHDESASCTGEEECSENSSQGIGEDGSSVLRLNMRELSGVYGYRKAPVVFELPKLRFLVGVYGAGSVSLSIGFGRDWLLCSVGVSHRASMCAGALGRPGDGGQRLSILCEQADGGLKGSEK
jgi:hypothetical protein